MVLFDIGNLKVQLILIHALGLSRGVTGQVFKPQTISQANPRLSTLDSFTVPKPL